MREQGGGGLQAVWSGSLPLSAGMLMQIAVTCLLILCLLCPASGCTGEDVMALSQRVSRSPSGLAAPMHAC